MRIPVQKYLPIAVGVVLACVPIVAFSYWLDGNIASRARVGVQLNANRAVLVINARLGRTVAALNTLAASGVVTCSPEHIEMLRKAAFATSSIKELSIIGADRKLMCADIGIQLGGRQVIGTPYQTKLPNIMLEVLRLNDVHKNMVRVRRVLGDGSSVAALVAPDMFMPVASSEINQGYSYVRVTGPDGASIAEINGKVIEEARPDELFSTTAESELFGIRATVSNTRTQVASESVRLRVGGYAFSAVIGIAVLCFVVLLTRRQHQQSLDPAAEFKAALAAGEFVPFYQPIIDIVSGKLIGAEVLARWRKPDGSLVSPGGFVYMMEQNGLIGDLSRHLMRQACADLGVAYGSRPQLRVSFNLTAEQFESEDIVGEVRSIFAHSPVRLSQIVLELTERQEPKSFSKTRQVIASLQVLGCRVALDDVGTGHSGLSSILKLGVDIIKIDKIFVDSMDDDRNSATIIGTLVDLARKMGMDIVAEGVERFEQVVDLRRRGIRAAQGFVFAPALPASAFLQLVEAVAPQQGAGAVKVADSRDNGSQAAFA